MRQLLLFATLGFAMVSEGCSPPSVAGRTWNPVINVEESGAPGPGGLSLVLPGETGAGPAGERVDPEQYLIAAVRYDSCHWADPRLVGIAADRVEVQLTELNRFCFLPMLRIAWFSIPWSELPSRLTLVDQLGEETRLQDQRRV